MPDPTQIAPEQDLGPDLDMEDWNLPFTGDVENTLNLAVAYVTMADLMLSEIKHRLQSGARYYITLGGIASSLVNYAGQLEDSATYLERVVLEYDCTRAQEKLKQEGQNTTRENDNATNR